MIQTANQQANQVQESHSNSELPDTGEEDNHQGLIGGVLAAFGGLTLLGRRRKKEEK
ncbi:LPXTG cell wall anchor domain-containing protein [Staphylococcus epidermidis]|uniref:LPXTG cell wall anchor domain-containing protein n=1 Tax=Staphylococcus epidermidis TaxID=1282 RepID=UPI00155834A8